MTDRDHQERRARFWIQGTTDFNKGLAMRWHPNHSNYTDYAQGYLFAQAQAKAEQQLERKRNSWLRRATKKVKAWLLNW
ncbi:MAG: hypothetical protein DI616_15750 [Paracoccus denitrificans]|uniref:Uncharacterized protein n=1 Tax=Paracoccus denitrificans TaxID=266 RepID=A0A533I587_PARDE|nr:MAG: hypothetical protein DI616_15750 [Paracoccus denitrificans]